MEQIIKTLAKELEQSEKHIENVITLIDEGNTIPFIARYRKEMHGSMDDTLLRKLEEIEKDIDETRKQLRELYDEQRQALTRDINIDKDK